METKQKLKVGDKIIYIAESAFGFTNGEEYAIYGIDEEDFMFYYVIDDNDRKNVFYLINFEKYFKLKEKTAYKETNGKLFYELDFEFITQMAERMSSNKKEGKYGLFNWMKPMSKTDLINLIQAQYRHAMDLMNFKFEDDGRPYGTLEAFSNNAMMINYQLKTYFKDYKFSKQDLLEIQVSPSTKINTTDSTGLLTEEK